LEAKRIEANLLEKDTEIALLKEAMLDMQKLLKSPEKLAGLSKISSGSLSGIYI
jgi:hypothetical protein